jgi:hypothetical protein
MVRVAVANGVDVAALAEKGRVMIEERVAAAEKSERTSFSIGEMVALQTPRQRIYKMLCIAHSDDRKFPATILYNEGWLLRLVLDWFSRQPVGGHPLDFSSGARWFSEALLPSQFLPRVRGDRLAEGWTHADGIIGHITIGNGALANAALAKDASQFIVTEAKLFARLAPGVTNHETSIRPPGTLLVSLKCSVGPSGGLNDCLHWDSSYSLLRSRSTQGTCSTRCSRNNQ